MRIVIQRTQAASVSVNQEIVGSIDQGLLVLVGVEDEDTQEDVVWLANKVANMRIFSDDEGKMNLSVQDTSKQVLVVSQFTLHASTKKGNRPSFIKAGEPDFAQKTIESFCRELQIKHQLQVETGSFGADMQVQLVNDGPVTIVMDSKHRE